MKKNPSEFKRIRSGDDWLIALWWSDGYLDLVVSKHVWNDWHMRSIQLNWLCVESFRSQRSKCDNKTDLLINPMHTQYTVHTHYARLSLIINPQFRVSLQNMIRIMASMTIYYLASKRLQTEMISFSWWKTHGVTATLYLRVKIYSNAMARGSHHRQPTNTMLINKGRALRTTTYSWHIRAFGVAHYCYSIIIITRPTTRISEAIKRQVIFNLLQIVAVAIDRPNVDFYHFHQITLHLARLALFHSGLEFHRNRLTRVPTRWERVSRAHSMRRALQLQHTNHFFIGLHARTRYTTRDLKFCFWNVVKKLRRLYFIISKWRKTTL